MTALENRPVANPLRAPSQAELIGRAWTATPAGDDTLRPDMRPRRTPYVELYERDDERIAAVLAACDGARPARDIADGLGLALDDVLGTLETLYRHALVTEAGDTPVPGLAFLDHVRSACAMDRDLSLERRSGLDAAFASGSYSRRLALGYLVEVTHFIRAAASHISPAIAHGCDPHLQMMFAEYLAEEYWHGAWIEQSLSAGGLSGAEIARATPMPENAAVINTLRHAAQTDVLLYSSLLALNESDQDDAADLEQQFATMVGHGVLPRAAWLPFFQHSYEDGTCDHLAYGAEAFARARWISREQQDVVRRGALLQNRNALRFEYALLDFYGPEDGPAVHSVDW